MNHLQLFSSVARECAELITKRYSTSFSMGIRMFSPEMRPPIYSIYGFVRFADEIVDTFHGHDKADLLRRFKEDTYRAIDEKISLNPVLQAYQEVVNHYGIDQELTDAFLRSMEMDLYKDKYESEDAYNEYIYGSAEVVGLMCLKVFCHEQPGLYDELKASARRLGAAFQKINFLRDLKSDFDDRGRVYFPGVDFTKFDDKAKLLIEDDIKADFDAAYQGIIRLPKGSRFGVYLAYKYYLNLFHKIKNVPALRVADERIRVNDSHKAFILLKSAIRSSVNVL